MPPKKIDRRVSVAPMMDWTDRHCRFFHRLIAPDILLYTEMVTAPAIIHGDREKLLGFSEGEKPLALQLGGSNTDALARCAEIGAAWGYDEINLNCGCPSERVQEGSFGACLMNEPQTVAACVAAMQRATQIPVTVKSRIGIDDFDHYDFLKEFIGTVAAAGCKIFIVHARKAILKGLSPRENREVPPLVYDHVYRAKQEFPQLTIILNGGIQTTAEAQEHLRYVDGIMLGRVAYHHPWLLNDLQSEILQKPTGKTPEDIIHDLLPYVREQIARGVKLSSITRHLLGLFQSIPGARAWRRILTEEANRSGASVDLVLEALQAVSRN